MSELGILSDRYQRISEWLLKFNDAVMFLKDVYLGKLQYEAKAVETWMDTIAGFLKEVLQYEVSQTPSQLAVPEIAILAVHNVVLKDPFLRSSVEKIYETLSVGRYKSGLSKEDFDVLDRIAAILSENSSQAFRRLWRHR